MYLDAAQLGHKDLYKILIATVSPRPIAWAGTRSRQGQDNLAPFSFYNVFSARPPVVGFSPIPHEDGSPKDTLRNIEEGGCFTLSCVSHRLVKQMSRSSALLAHGESEFDHAGLHAAQARSIDAPYVAESPVVFECRLLQVLRFGEGPGAGCLVLGEITHLHIDDAIYQDGRLDMDELDTVGRLAGNWYCTIRDRFEMQRG